MQNKIIPLAMAAAIAIPELIAAVIPAPAYADTTNANANIYGIANVSFDSVNSGSFGATSGATNTKVSSNASRLGFKGTEDLGDGVKALWQIESLINVDSSAGTSIGTRNTYAGLNSENLGTVLLGYQDTPYKLATRKLDVFADTLGDNRSLLGSVKGTNALVAFDGRQSDALAYISPVFNGITVAAAYVAGAETAVANDTKGSAWSLAGWYDAAPFYGSLAYEVHDIGSTNSGDLAGASNTATVYAHAGSKESAWKLGAGYKLDAVDLSFAYEKTTDNLGGTGAPPGDPSLVAGANVFGHSAYYIAGKYNIGSNAVKVAYAHAGNLAGAASGKDTSASQFTAGYDRSLSKLTTVYVLYTKLNNGANVKYALSSASTATGTTAASVAGASPSAWSLGLKHAF
ncbi:MAG: porin [Nitrosomonadales bacterium]|nr:porin [Nitrosomonadales bacterium]